jgi:phosphatidate cytidylyltransferase
MLKQRMITALILLPLVLALLFLTPLDYFVTVIVIVTYLIALEWAKLAGFKKSFQCSLYAFSISSFNLILWYFASDLKFWPSISWPHQLVWDLPLIVLAISVAAIAIAIIIVLTYSKLPKWWANLPVRFVLGFAMLPAFFVSLVSIRSVNYIAGDFYFGGQLLLMMFSMIWAADTGAYFTGKAFGKTKLAANVSPNKTWEGVIGGLSLSFIVAWLGAYLLNLDIQNPALYSLVALLLASVSVLGDLFESALKRVANIKDSGNLLPGHGGVYDRLDSSIVVAPLFYLIYSYHGWY